MPAVSAIAPPKSVAGISGSSARSSPPVPRPCAAARPDRPRRTHTPRRASHTCAPPPAADRGCPVGAVGVLLHHAQPAAPLALDPLQSRRHGMLGRIVHLVT